MAFPAQDSTPFGGPVRLVPRVSRNRFPVRKPSQDVPWIFFLLLHAPLVIAMKASVMFATVHAFVTILVGISSLRFRSPERVIFVLGYVMAAEPLWRVSNAMVFYETGKYALGGLSILAIFRYRLLHRADKTYLFYFLLLLPSLLVLPYFDRRQISFNLSGPFSLMMVATFLSTQQISARTLRKLFLVTLAPILGLTIVATYSTLTIEVTSFYTSKVASGGIGQNQASSIFGLGLVFAIFFLYIDRENRMLRWLIAAIGVWCATQAALTFSRGGVATAIGTIAAASFFLLRERHKRGSVVLGVGFLLLAGYLVVPQLNEFTDGAFGKRFTSTHLTGRDKIMQADVIAFKENPLFGVGPGESKDYHLITTGRRASSHTEYSRLLAEHGVCGAISLLLLLGASVRRLLRQTSMTGRALAAGFTVWTLLYMFHAAMRMAAASFIFGLGAALLVPMAAAPGIAAARHRRQRAGPAPSRPPLARPSLDRPSLAPPSLARPAAARPGKPDSRT